MKIAFLFTNKPDIAQIPTEWRLRSNFEVPDAAKSLPDIQTKVQALADFVTQFTSAYVHLNCAELGIKNLLITLDDAAREHPRGLDRLTSTTCLYFGGWRHFANGNNIQVKQVLTIYAPVSPVFPPMKGRFASRYYRTGGYKPDSALGAYTGKVQALAEQLLALLNVNTASDEWGFNGFQPDLQQKSLVKKYNASRRKAIAAVQNKGREEEKRLAREAKLSEKQAANPNPPQPLTHGAGRTIGARPGIYGGVQMRSQLEIRFASELDERGIKWVYECEALGAASYLVDFYLPDLGVWVEVKGRFEARDRQVLPEIAKMLKTERKHRLLVYTGSGKCCVVNPSGFREVERKDFWGELMR